MLREAFFRRYYRSDFLKRLPHGAKVLDVGCGNDSPRLFKEARSDIYYVGLDVGDYRHTRPPTENADEFVVVASDEFAAAIEKWRGRFDAVFSQHNIEHCEEPDRVIKAMAACLKPGGTLFLAFPTEASVKFPSRQGTLNFYDDSTHQQLPDFSRIIELLKSTSMYINFNARRYRPYKHAWRGLLNELESRKTKTVMRGTWALWGFESIIWASKSNNPDANFSAGQTSKPR
ncbi:MULTISPECIES: class I SAM-dependent methyltransferase [Methylobacterium]|nr:MULTISPECIES: class I SAM-dependent methyltransferase [Methylobacterium]